MQGLAGKPVNVETLGGYIQYKYGGFLPLVIGLWSILALSATLAGESRRGSMDLLAAAPLSRRRIASRRLLGHILMVGVAMASSVVAIAMAGSALPPFRATRSRWRRVRLRHLAGLPDVVAAGALAFALAPFVGRGSAAGLAGAVMLGGFLLNGYQQAIPQLAPFANLTWCGWTTNHIPLADQFDWASLGSSSRSWWSDPRDRRRGVRPPRPGRHDAPSRGRACRGPAGLGGPAARATSERFSTGLSWGLGLGVFGLLIAGSGAAFIEQIGESPEFERAAGTSSRASTSARSAASCSCVFIEFGLVLAGLAAAGLVGGWASDERSGVLEMLLPTPVRRTLVAVLRRHRHGSWRSWC